ncbi:MAG: amidohydrolase family protein, partial [Bdellovibrionota bacterium]
SLEIGKKADLVAIDLLEPSVAVEASEKEPENIYSALVYSASPQCVRQTWVDGRSVFRAGSYPGTTVRDIVLEAMRERKKLFARLRK